MSAFAGRRLVFLVLVVGAGLLGIWWWQTSAPALNLLMITLDTTRADRLGAWGGPVGLTPILDDLAKRGIVFERAYAPVPITLPSHASLMTGLYPPEHGLRVNNGVNRLGADIPVLAELLGRHGYRTGAFVGAFVLDSQFGLDRGFEHYDDEMSSDHVAADGDAHGHRMRAGQDVVSASLAWLTGRRREHFFCWVHLFDPHTPYSPREELFGEKYRDRPYDAGVACVDRQVGRLLDFLKRHGLEQRTVVVVAGDHGESLGEHGERTHGYTLYDATMQVPLLIRLPGNDPPARRVAVPVSLVDVFPTLLELLKIDAPSGCSGRTLVPAVRGEQLDSAACYAETNHPFEEAGAAPLRCLLTDRWKYIRSPRRELYDLSNDPRELRNVAEFRSAEVDELEAVLQEQEARFVQRDAPTIVLSPPDRRKLASLGYLGGDAAETVTEEQLPDIKDLLPHINAHSDAQGLMRTGEFQSAIGLLEPVVRAAPDYFQAWFNLGVCFQQLNQIAAAEQALQRAVEIDGNAPARIALSKLYLSQQRVDQAMPQLEAAIRLEPDSVEGQFLLGVAYRFQGRDQDARRQYQRVLQQDPEFLPAHQALKELP